MKIADGIEALELDSNAMGVQSVIYPTLIWDNEDAILIDTGFPNHMSALRKAVEDAGVAFEKINRIILTHQDIDHIGNLPDVVKSLDGRG